MKEVLLSADNSAKLCRVPDRVAERLEEVAWLFAGEWLWQSPDAGRFHQMRDGIDTVVYDERDFLWWLGAVYAPEEPPELVRDLGVWADEPGEAYAALPRYNF